MRNIRECNVAVVGGAGFLGSHLVDHLIEDRGCTVLVIDNLVAGRQEFVNPKAHFVHYDITGSEERLRRVFVDMKNGYYWNRDHGRTGGVEPYEERGFYVFNYAAYPYIPDSFARPIQVADVNFMGAMKVINAAQEAGCDGILQVSSAEIYGGPPTRPHEGWGLPITEQHEVAPHSSYGVAKAAVDYAVQVRWREARTPCIALRQFNCCGERETHPYIVPEIISQLSRQGPANQIYEGRTTCMNTKATVHLGNDSFRDFMYAGDAVRIAVELLERGEFGSVYNLGSEAGVKMFDLAKLIGKLMGFAEVKVERDEARVRPWEIWHLQADVSKICRETTWDGKMRTSLEEALRRTIEWYDDNGRKWPWEK